MAGNRLQKYIDSIVEEIICSNRHSVELFSFELPLAGVERRWDPNDKRDSNAHSIHLVLVVADKLVVLS